MNTFKELFNLCKLYDGEPCERPTKEQRQQIKEYIAEKTSDIVNKTISKEDIEILRSSSFGFIAKYFDYNKEKFIKITFSMMTKKAYIFNGTESMEFQVL